MSQQFALQRPPKHLAGTPERPLVGCYLRKASWRLGLDVVLVRTVICRQDFQGWALCGLQRFPASLSSTEVLPTGLQTTPRSVWLRCVHADGLVLPPTPTNLGGRDSHSRLNDTYLITIAGDTSRQHFCTEGVLRYRTERVSMSCRVGRSAMLAIRSIHTTCSAY